LIVDDEPDILTLFRLILTKAGFGVITAHDATECYSKLEYEQPDLFLLDVIMPEIDGYKLCKQIKSDPKTKNTPVVLFTVINCETCKEQANEAGADGFLNKPLTSEDQIPFLKTMNALLA
jgi:CheY-like chemotaxis protein